MTQLTLEDVKQKFAIWRQTAKRCQKIPDHLIEDAKKLSKNYNITKIVEELRLNWGGKPYKEISKFQKKYINSLDIESLNNLHITQKYPKKIKNEIVLGIKNGAKIREVSNKFNISEDTIVNWIYRRKKKNKTKKEGNAVLLKDIFDIFKSKDIEEIPTLDLLYHLWRNPNPIYSKYNTSILARHLTFFHIHSKALKFKFGDKNFWKRGFEKSQFEKAWKDNNIAYNIPALDPDKTPKFDLIDSEETNHKTNRTLSAKDVRFVTHEKKSETNLKKGSYAHPRTKLSEEWELPGEWRQWALDNGMQSSKIDMIAANFKTYWLIPGNNSKRKLDWFSAWKRWCYQNIGYSPTFEKEAPKNKNISIKEFKEYMKGFDNVIYKNGVYHLNKTEEEIEKISEDKKEITFVSNNKYRFHKMDNYIFVSKLLFCIIIYLLFFLKLSYYEMLCVFSITYNLFSIIEYFILSNFLHADSNIKD